MTTEEQVEDLIGACELALSFIDRVNCKAPDDHPLYRNSAVVSEILQATLARAKRNYVL